MNKIKSSKKELSELLLKINHYGYSKGVNQFLKNNSEYEYRFSKMEGNIAFRVTNKNNARCLVINSDLGNIPESISEIYDEVYSLETDKEKNLIQKFRFKEKNINNIKLISSDIESLPFHDEYFDLVIIDGIKINKKQIKSSKIIIKIFKEINRVLSPNGCLCAGLHNKYGLNIFKNKKDQFLFSNSFNGYKSLFNSIGFKVKSYWVLPSHKKPHHSGEIDNAVSLKWFFQNFDKTFSVDKKFKIIGMFLKIFNSTTRKLLVKFFFPSFLFYCYKENIPQTLENMIIEKTGFNNIIQNVRLTKVMYFLLDRFGNPGKIITCKITKYNLTERIFPVKRVFPKMEDPNEKIIIEKWFAGKVLDRLNVNDVNLAIKWLIDFQKQTMSENISHQDIEDEVNNLKMELKKIEAVQKIPYTKWLEEYKNHIWNIELKKTGVHGDFQVRNILIDQKNSSVNVIDWDWRFQEKGNPIYDFMWLTANIMMISNDTIKEFCSNLSGNGKAVISVSIIKEKMKTYFDADLDFIILLRFIILRFITIRVKDGGTGYLLYVELLKILNNVNSSSVFKI